MKTCCKPPCPVSLETATKFIAATHGLIVLATLIFSSVALVSLASHPEAKILEGYYTGPSDILASVKDWCEKLEITKPKQGKHFQDVHNFQEISLKETVKANIKVKETGQKFYSENHLTDEKVYQAISVLTLLIVLLLVIFVLDIELYNGARQRNVWRINIWYQIFRSIALAAIIFLWPIVISTSSVESEFTYKFWALLGSKVVAIFYILWILRAFISELETEHNSGKKRN